MKYLIDANTFITPHRGYAPMDVAVTLWNKFKGMSDTGTILLLDRVQNELSVNADALRQWIDEDRRQVPEPPSARRHDRNLQFPSSGLYDVEGGW